MADPDPKYEKYARSIRTMLTIAGLWPGTAPFSHYGYVIMFIGTTDFVLLMASVVTMYYNFSELTLIIKSMSLCITGVNAVLKTVMFTWNRAGLAKMHKTLEKTFRDDYSRDDLQKILLSPLSVFYRVNFVVSRCFMGIPIAYCLGPWISLIVQLMKGAEKLKYSMPLKITKYPWDPTKNGTVFFFNYLFEAFGALSIGIISASTDAAFAFYVFQISSQFRTLTHQITNLKATDDYNAVIKRCIARQRVLNECCECLQRVYGPVVLWYMVSSAINLCANIYQILKIGGDDTVACIIFIVGKLVQTMVYAWFGTFLSTESEAFCDGAYECDWPGSGEKSLMTNILIMLMGKRMVLSACNFSTITLNMFVGIVNTAMSYFFLLQTLEEKK